MDKPARSVKPLARIIRDRWSPRAFSKKLITDDDLQTILEAARWAPSAYNAQPWHFIVAGRGDEDDFEAMVACLVAKNQVWAKHASVLMISVARQTYEHNGEINHYAEYDTGQAAMAMTLQAVDLGIRSHQMAGFDAEKARATYAIPEGFTPLSAIAFGYDGDVESLPSKLQKMETAKRQRRARDEFVFRRRWGKDETP